MNTKRYLSNNFNEFPKSKTISINVQGYIQTSNLKIKIENITEVLLECDLRKLSDIQKGINLDLSILLKTATDDFSLKESGLTALNIFGFLDRYLLIKNAKSSKLKVEESDLYCLTCESYKRKNRKKICRLCQDNLVVRNLE